MRFSELLSVDGVLGAGAPRLADWCPRRLLKARGCVVEERVTGIARWLKATAGWLLFSGEHAALYALSQEGGAAASLAASLHRCATARFESLCLARFRRDVEPCDLGSSECLTQRLQFRTDLSIPRTQFDHRRRLSFRPRIARCLRRF